jgi:hypothetical protein
LLSEVPLWSPILETEKAAGCLWVGSSISGFSRWPGTLT